jgi:hypothetical protein
MTSWTHDPIERARYLDGECPPAEAAVRRQDLARDPAAAERVRRDEAFLAVVRGAGTGPVDAPEILEARVRRAIAADRAAGFPSPGGGEAASRRRRRFALATACVALLGAGTAWLAMDRVPETSAADPRALAAQALREASRGELEAGETGVACGERQAASPHRFPPVSGGEFSLTSCDTDGRERSVSVLTKEGAPKELRGLVAVPWDGKSTSTDVGWKRVGDDVVVFDVSIGGVKYYLATRWATVSGTTSCAACHGEARSSKPDRNPHHIFERKP